MRQYLKISLVYILLNVPIAIILYINYRNLHLLLLYGLLLLLAGAPLNYFWQNSQTKKKWDKFWQKNFSE